MAEEPRLRLIGWGPFRLPGEARRWAEAEERARHDHALAQAVANTGAGTEHVAGPAGPSADVAPGARPHSTAAGPAPSPAGTPDTAAPGHAPAPARVMAPLTSEERAILELLAEGHSVSSIARELSLSTRAVTAQVLTVNRKTGRSDQAGFAELVARLRLAEGEDRP
jgi:DNA-binding NarL/FixJ family response regulator